MKHSLPKHVMVFSVLVIFVLSVAAVYAGSGPAMNGNGNGQGQGYHRTNATSQVLENQDPVNGNAGELRGRDYVRMGELKNLEGILEQEDAEWFLRVEDRVYDLHMGPEGFRDSKEFVLDEGHSASVLGYVYKTDIAVSTITSGDTSIILRDANGRAAWAGTTFSNRQARN